MVETPVVRVESGNLKGSVTADGKVHIFKGVPYARPPIGNLRWRPPQPPEAWSGTRHATEFGPRCTQPDRPATSISYFGPEKESEDCLYLNIWTGTTVHGAKQPVMVWFHGGAFSVGSDSLPIFDGEALARRGVVVVTINYRLGGLGFLAHPDLTRESSTGACGNWGLHDQIAALRWIKNNIESFGGDPGCVTTFGQSAGSSTSNYLMSSKHARGLFHRAIGQSGGAVTPVGHLGGGSLVSFADSQEIGLRVARSFGCGRIEELRQVPADKIQLSWPKDPECRPWPSIDGYVISESPYDTFAQGRQYSVPLLTGANADEGATRVPAADAAQWKQTLRLVYGEDWQRIYEMYGNSLDIDAASRRQTGHITFNWVNWTWARLQARTGNSKVFFYRFGHAPPLPPDQKVFENDVSRLGAFHTAEIPYVFDNLSKRPWLWQEVDRQLAETMSSYWVNFATNGDPNGAGLPPWPAFDPETPSVLLIDDRIVAGNLPERKELDLWDLCMQHRREHNPDGKLALM